MIIQVYLFGLVCRNKDLSFLLCCSLGLNLSQGANSMKDQSGKSAVAYEISRVFGSVLVTVMM